MRVPISRFVFALSMLGAAPAFAADDPESVVNKFCSAHAAAYIAPYDDLLTPSLKQLIADAWKKNAEYEAAHPGDKPPLGDGIQFQSYPDSMPICRPGDVSSGAGDTTVDVEYAHDNAGWTDRLVLRADGDRLLIDDVLYGPEDFKVGLRSVLKSIIDGKF